MLDRLDPHLFDDEDKAAQVIIVKNREDKRREELQEEPLSGRGRHATNAEN
jgi:hypothetical protein